MTEQEQADLAMDMLGELVDERGLDWLQGHPDWGPYRQRVARRAVLAYRRRLGIEDD